MSFVTHRSEEGVPSFPMAHLSDSGTKSAYGCSSATLKGRRPCTSLTPCAQQVEVDVFRKALAWK